MPSNRIPEQQGRPSGFVFSKFNIYAAAHKNISDATHGALQSYPIPSSRRIMGSAGEHCIRGCNDGRCGSHRRHPEAEDQPEWDAPRLLHEWSSEGEGDRKPTVCTSSCARQRPGRNCRSLRGTIGPQSLDLLRISRISKWQLRLGALSE
jgi:hypothetical protein